MFFSEFYDYAEFMCDKSNFEIRQIKLKRVDGLNRIAIGMRVK
jgi:hypothetical protein